MTYCTSSTSHSGACCPSRQNVSRHSHAIRVQPDCNTHLTLASPSVKGFQEHASERVAMASASTHEEKARLPLRLAASGFWSGGPVRHALCARMGKGWMGSHARRFNERSVKPRARRSWSVTALSIVRVHRPKYKKEKFVSRVVWTIISNLLLLRAAFRAMRRADAVLFTGSPPLMLHFIAPLNVILRKQPDLPHHGLPSGMPYRRARTARVLFSIYCCVSHCFGGAVSILSKYWVSIRPGDSRIWVSPMSGFA